MDIHNSNSAIRSLQRDYSLVCWLHGVPGSSSYTGWLEEYRTVSAFAGGMESLWLMRCGQALLKPTRLSGRLSFRLPLLMGCTSLDRSCISSRGICSLASSNICSCCQVVSSTPWWSGHEFWLIDLSRREHSEYVISNPFRLRIWLIISSPALLSSDVWWAISCNSPSYD